MALIVTSINTEMGFAGFEVSAGVLSIQSSGVLHSIKALRCFQNSGRHLACCRRRLESQK